MSFRRQNWREFFAWEIAGPYFRDRNTIVQLENQFGWLWRFYIPMHRWNRDAFMMVLAPLAYLVLFGRWLKRMWFAPALALRKRGWLAKYTRGEEIHWFWPRYIGRNNPI